LDVALVPGTYQVGWRLSSLWWSGIRLGCRTLDDAAAVLLP
jgi:hypothetical protein